MSEIPDRINIDKKDRDLYNKLDNEEMLKSKGGTRTRKEQFITAMAIGFKNNVRRPLESKDGFVLNKDLRSEDMVLINSIAIHETESVEVLSDIRNVFKIAEEFAHGGIRLLVDKIDTISYGSFEKQFEKEICDLYNRLK